MKTSLLSRLRSRSASFRAGVPGLSISARLTLWYGLSMLILLGVFAAYLYASFHVALHQDFAAALQQEKAHAQAAIRTTHVAEEAARTGTVPVVALPVGADTYVRLLSPTGQPLARTANFDGTEALAATPPNQAEERVVARSFEGTRAQTLYAPIYEGGSGDEALRGWLEVTRLESALHRELHRLAWLLGIGALLGVAVALGAGYGLSRRALRPVADLTRAARTIHRQRSERADESAAASSGLETNRESRERPSRRAPHATGRRLPVPAGARDELTALAEAFNDMIAALERSLAETRQSFEREKRFRADAAHELMTPVSAIRSETEITLRRERKPAAYQQSLQAIQERAAHMSALVERLLTLSRLEAGRPRGGPSGLGGGGQDRRVNLSALACAAAGRAKRRAQDRGPSVETSVEPEVLTWAAEEDLAAVVENLLSNAVKYTPAGGTVRCIVEQNAGEALVRVEDTGEGFEGSGTALFERFRRGPSEVAQQGGTPGTGLGLAIVRAVAEAYGGRVRAESAGRGRGSTFEVALPTGASRGAAPAGGASWAFGER